MPADTSRLATALADRYRIERQLGAGGMATVYLAIDLKHDREVALKVLRPELGAVLGDERFLAEIKITAKLDHPHILTLIDSGVAEGYLYYVLPLVRGESLRDKLNRDKQLGVEEAVTLTKQVAGALDYAHRHGVVHRDIKPENILLQEGEAMLTDFGIALAVSEAGGDRLTETGLSLGTPQYMSPEQATGDRLLSARSDVYSLGAVLYEMLAGEPPVTGPTSQAMIAKLMTEKPVSLRVVRPSTPEAIDLAVQKALDKTPADRFPTAGDFARALDLKTVTATQPVVPERRSGNAKLVVGAVVLALVAAGAFLAKGRLGAGERGGPYVLKDRTQLTYTGQVFSSAITPDGKQLAYITRQCTGTGCTYAVEIQDVGGTATHRVLEGATSSYGLEWSPDRRNLIFYGTYKNRFGAYLVSALGEAPRYLTSTSAMFWAGGDSLIVAPATANDSVYWLKVMSLAGAVGDSIAVRDPDFGEGTSIGAVGGMPNGRWIVANVIKRSRGLWRVIDRQGTVASEVLNSCTCGGRMSDNGLWLARSGAGFESIIRIGIDSATGKLSERQDTLLSGLFHTFSITADGGTLVYDDGTSDDQLWATELGGALGGKFPDDRRLARSSTRMAVDLAPDGQRLLVGRQTPVAGGGVELRFTVMPFAGGAEAPLNVPTSARGARWFDSVTVGYGLQTPAGVRLALVDVRSGKPVGGVELPDSLLRAAVPVPQGWAWIPAGRDRIIVDQGGTRREFPKPAWFTGFFDLDVDRTGSRLLAVGWNAGSFDSLGVVVAPVAGGEWTLWRKEFAEDGTARFLDDGGMVFIRRPTQETMALEHLPGPGVAHPVGTIPRVVADLAVSGDLRRVAIVERTPHGDAWMSHIARQ